ncbi:hypothetical protein F4678DRAFT_428168 [Xylaria arbuscula]|nr:hypothetical protein F4678DRAFT_428168 [Xylaria arbuscula]
MDVLRDLGMVGLGDMPLEILEDIVLSAVSFRVSSKAAELATVNSVWQSIVETKTFQQLRLNVDDISTAMRILRNRPERFGLVRLILFHAILPAYTAAECTTLETPQDRFSNDIVFSKAINRLLTYLTGWPSTGKTLELQLYAFSPTDARALLGTRWFRYQYGIIPGDVLHNRTYGSVLEIYSRTADKPIPAVTKLTFRDDCERYIAVSGLEHLFRIFTGLRDMDIRFWDIYKHDPDNVRQGIRRHMAKTLDQMPKTVSSMRFNVAYYPPADQRFQGPRTYEGEDKSDPLSVAFRKATQKMTVVDVHGMLGTPELFWPNNPASLAPVWPNLEDMVLYYHIINPAGEWLFEPDRGPIRRIQADLPFYDLPPEMVPDEDIRPMQNRFTPNEDMMEAFYIAIAKAVTHMPKLKHLHCQAITFWNSRIVPLHVLRVKIEDRIAHATWSGNPPFEPTADTLKAWRMMAYERGFFLSLEARSSESHLDESNFASLRL